jgi:Fe-S-cluster containining protein
MDILQMSKSYKSINGLPIISKIDTGIFTNKYLINCMNSDCNDKCCSYGVDVSGYEIKQIMNYKELLEDYLRISSDDWFSDIIFKDNEYPSGYYRRTKTINGRCVFLNIKGKGCRLHSFAIENGIDYHKIKPMISCLFPITFDNGVLQPSHEIYDKELYCMNAGLPLYDGVKEDIKYYFGLDMFKELDEMSNNLTLIKV